MPRQANNEGTVSKNSKQATPEQVWIAFAHCYRAMSSLIERSFQDSGLSLTDFTLLEALLHKGSMTITEIRMLPYLGATRQHIVDYENHRRRLETGKCPHHGTGCNRRNLHRVGGDLLSQSCKRVRSGCQPAECGCEAFGSSPLPALPHQGRSSRGHNQGPNCPEHSAPNVPQLSSRLCLSLIF
jgi:hypothetical protein